MKTRWIVMVVPCLLVLGNLGGQAGEKMPNFYPLKEGNAWHYRADINGKTGNYVGRIAKMEMGMAVLEGAMDGKVIATEHLSQAKEGILRHKYNGMGVDPPLLLLPYPVKAKDKWSGKLKIGPIEAQYAAESREEKVKVPAGEFKAIRVDISMVEMGNKVSTSYWFVQDIGFVKQTVQLGTINIVVELEKHTLK